ncbi:MAG TPA: hypothetical protein VMK16_18280 [Acidimicrobiales bacterium]|nr:hypothetical protein [Acidimicrobiales bacterium]
MKRLAIGIGAVALLLGGRTTSFAFHSGDMAVSSTLAHGGALTIGYDFSTVVRANYDPVLTSVLPPGMTGYSNDEPGFDALDTDFPGDGLFIIDPGTQVSVEITAIDDGTVGMVLNGTPLLHVGDSTVLGTQGGVDGIHHHPSWQIYLMLPAGSYGDARVSFRIKRTGGATAYADSSVFTLRVSNGHLFPPEWDTTAYDSASVKCQQTLGKAVRKFTGTLQKALEGCLDKVTVVTATAATGGDTTKAEATAARTCGDANGTLPPSATMLGKIAAARQKALDGILKACGPSGSNTYDDNAISQHLGLAACNVEDTMSGGYHGAHEALEAITQGGQPVTESLPCLFPTSEAD